MLPCRKNANSEYAVRYLSRATSMARSLPASAGSKRSIIDGCLLEGKKVGGLLSATVIEPEGELLAWASNTNFDSPDPLDIRYMLRFRASAGGSSPYRPNTPIAPPIEQTIDNISRDFRSLSIFVGGKPEVLPSEPSFPVTYENPPPPGTFMICPPGISSGDFFVYRACYMEGGDSSDDMYIQVVLASPKGNYTVFIRETSFRPFMRGGGIGREALGYWARRVSIIETGYGAFTLVFNTGEEIMPYAGGVLRSERLLRLDVDLLLRENADKKKELGPSYVFEEDWIPPDLSGALFPTSLVPENLQPDWVLVYTGVGEQTSLIPSISAMTVTDLALDAGGELVAAIKWEVKRQDGEKPNQSYLECRNRPLESHLCWGIGVAAIGAASWGGARSFFDIHSKEVFSSSYDDSPLREEHGVSPDYALVGDRAIFIGPDIHRWVYVVNREVITKAVTTSLFGDAYLSPPFVKELINGVESASASPIDVFGDISYARSGMLFPYGASMMAGSNNFYLHSDWTREAIRDSKVRVSDTAVALSAGGSLEVVNTNFVQSVGQGIAFIEGGRRRYEELSTGRTTPQFRVVTVTCHQREVRSEDGELVSPCVLVVGAMYNGVPSVLVRKGPIWEEDMDNGYDFEKFWTVADAATHSYGFYFYMGSPLMNGKLGRMFL